MLFQITHTHSHDTCPAVFPERRETLASWWGALASSGDVKVVSATAAPLDHVLFLTLEAESLDLVISAMAPLNALGSAETRAVVSVEALVSRLARQP